LTILIVMLCHHRLMVCALPFAGCGRITGCDSLFIIFVIIFRDNFNYNFTLIRQSSIVIDNDALSYYYTIKVDGFAVSIYWIRANHWVILYLLFWLYLWDNFNNNTFIWQSKYCHWQWCIVILYHHMVMVLPSPFIGFGWITECDSLFIILSLSLR
jgi:hypothetical protein